MYRQRIISASLLALGVLLVLAFYLYHDSELYHKGTQAWLENASDSEIHSGGFLSRGHVSLYVNAILDQGGRQHPPKLDCLNPDLSRYEYLRPSNPSPQTTKYFFALNLRENLPVLPRLMGSVVEAIQFLGPENCALSIVEGISPDGTSEVLAALQPRLDSRIRTHFVLNSPINSHTGSRFEKLAELRNLALKPMLDEPARYSNATIVFINDVVICPDDILELVHQRDHLGADMTCAFDWIYGSSTPTFYDAFVARGINGDLFFDVPPVTVSWENATKLFWNDPESKERYYAGKPLQVFACWNGAVALAAQPLVSKQIAFRGARQDLGECVKGEPELLCKDLWHHGHGKIAIVPYINLVYPVEHGKQIKDEKGYTFDKAKLPASEAMIQWKPPPEMVKCMPIFNYQSWRPWNETLDEMD